MSPHLDTIPMAQSKHEITSLLAQANTQPRHRFGQNFMIDQNLVRLVADAGQVNSGDLVIEVGPGTGTLTEELLSRSADVLAVEIDRDLAALLRQRLSDKPNFRLIEGDALSGKHDLHPDLESALSEARQNNRPAKLIANLPYNIASPLVIELLIRGVHTLAFTVQKEVADRLRALPGTDAYGALTAMAQLLSNVEVLRTLPPQAFWPPPKIESSLVRLTRNDRLGTAAPGFSRFLQALFSARRKTLRKALEVSGVDADTAIATTNLDPRQRAEELPPPTLFDLYRAASPS